MRKIIYIVTLICLTIIFIIFLTYKSEKKSIQLTESLKNISYILIDSSGNEESINTIPVGNYKINKNKTHCENGGIISEYNNENGTLTYNFIGEDECVVYFEKFTKTLTNYIIDKYTKNGMLNVRNDFSKPYEDVNDYLFYTAETDNAYTSYYYSGQTNNNWVKFGSSNGWYGCQNSEGDYTYSSSKCGENQTSNGISINSGTDYYWRIVRTDENGSLKLLYAGTSPDTKSPFIGNSWYNPLQMFMNNRSVENPYATLFFIEQNFGEGFVPDVLISNKVNGNYISIPYHLVNLWSNNMSQYTDSSEYCVYTKSNVIQDRLNQGLPTLKCETKKTSNVGVLTADEITFAGGKKDNNGGINSYYSLNSKGEKYNDSWWTLSVYGVDDVNLEFSTYSMYYVLATGNLQGQETPQISSIRPVITLNNCANYLKGDGTSENPYEVDLSNC